MKPIAMFILIVISWASQEIAQHETHYYSLEGRTWVLEKFRDPRTREVLFPNEYHYLLFERGEVKFSIDCNRCSIPYKLISNDSINIYGSTGCTRKNCLKEDAIEVAYSGKYKIWKENGFLIIRTKGWDHIYK